MTFIKIILKEEEKVVFLNLDLVNEIVFTKENVIIDNKVYSSAIAEQLYTLFDTYIKNNVLDIQALYENKDKYLNLMKEVMKKMEEEKKNLN